MIIVDTKLQELEKQGRPIRVGLVGAGFAGRGLAIQLLTRPIGMRLVAIANRTIEFARQAFTDAGVDVGDVTDDPIALCQRDDIDVIVEATGEVEFGAKVAMAAIKNKKHIVVINAELDATLGPILKQYADRAGVVYTQGDGDQPAVCMNLFRWVVSLGFEPVLVGNIKSLIDTKRTPATQEKFAREHFQRPKFITTFADGTKISFENATIANALGFRIAKRGMLGPKCSFVTDAPNVFPKNELEKGGFVDYILGAEPSFGVFVIGKSDHPIKQRYMNVYKMGDGPYYTFYVPYHLSPLETPNSIARAFLFGDATLAPKGQLSCEVITVAKKDLKRGDALDGYGGFTSYGVIENYAAAQKENLLPMGLSQDCTLVRDIPMDQPITRDDVEFPKDRLSLELRKEQEAL